MSSHAGFQRTPIAEARSRIPVTKFSTTSPCDLGRLLATEPARNAAALTLTKKPLKRHDRPGAVVTDGLCA